MYPGLACLSPSPRRSRKPPPAGRRPDFPNRSLAPRSWVPARALQGMGRRMKACDRFWVLDSSHPLREAAKPWHFTPRPWQSSDPPFPWGLCILNALVCTREPWGDGSSVGEAASGQIQAASVRSPQAV